MGFDLLRNMQPSLDHGFQNHMLFKYYSASTGLNLGNEYKSSLRILTVYHTFFTIPVFDYARPSIDSCR